MYKCYECGHIFSDCDASLKREYMGECHGFPAYEETYVCPVCGGGFADARLCRHCRDWFLPWELIDGMCDDCASMYEPDENCN